MNQCKTCQKCFISKSKLDRHIRTHTGEKSYECSKCGRRFRGKDQLQKHEAIHDDERRFKCNICPDERRFKTKSALSKHMVFHYEPKYPCSKCGKKFYTPTHLKRHKERKIC